MTIAEQIADVLGVKSTDVTVNNNESARLKDRELTENEIYQIDEIFNPDKHYKDSIDQAFEKIAKAIEETPPENRSELAQKIRDAKPKKQK